MPVTGKFDTAEELYAAVTHSMRRTQKETAEDCGIERSRVSAILIEEKMRSKIWRGKHGDTNR